MPARRADPTSPSSDLRVLFIGNSYTARNNLPALIASLAAARGRRLEHRMITVGGASLRMHWNKGEAAAAIGAGRWDYVVLQEQSTLPIKNAARMHENVRLFDRAIRDAGAKTALYMTWARAHAPESQDAITAAYRSVGEEIGALVVPVGQVWQRFIGKHSEPVLHDEDQSHPTLAGSYLMACVFDTTLFDEPAPAATRVDGLSEAYAKLLRAAAWPLPK